MSSPAKILAVDDSELIHRMYDLTLMRYRRHGCEVLHARNGLEALAVLREHRDVDIIVLDINMPVMDGLSFLQERQRMQEFGEIPVVIVSTEGREADTIRGLEAGATAYVMKPFKPSDLHAIIDRIAASAP